MKKILSTLILSISLFNHAVKPENMNCFDAHPQSMTIYTGLTLVGMFTAKIGREVLHMARKNRPRVKEDATKKAIQRGRLFALIGIATTVASLQAINLLCAPYS